MNQEVVLILFQVLVLVLAFSVHESAHAYTAMRLGDPTAYMLGRVTLNPAKHFAMAVIALLLLIVFKHAVPGGAPAIGTAMALASKIPGVDTTNLPALFPVALFLYFAVIINLALFVFNLFPIPPLDGSHVLRNFLPYSLQESYARIGTWGLILFFIFGGRLIGMFYYPLLNSFDHLLAIL